MKISRKTPFKQDPGPNLKIRKDENGDGGGGGGNSSSN